MEGKWSKIEKAYLVKNHSRMTNQQIADELNRTKSAVQTKACELGLKKILSWTKEMDKELEGLYADFTSSQIAKKFNTTRLAIKNRVIKLGLRKLSNSGCFKKGFVPHNKGEKMSPEVYKKVKHTFFQPGNIPGNHKTIGSVRISKDGYYEIKTKEPRTWEFVHRLIWKAHHQLEINKDEIIIFMDGNCENLAIDNLKKIDRAQHIANMRESDCYIAYLISRENNVRKEVLKRPDIIELKRNLLKLKKAIRDE